MNPKLDPDARVKWKAAWRTVRCYGTIKDMPKVWLKRSNLFRYLAYMRLMDRRRRMSLEVPVTERLWQLKVVEELIADMKAKGEW